MSRISRDNENERTIPKDASLGVEEGATMGGDTFEAYECDTDLVAWLEGESLGVYFGISIQGDTVLPRFHCGLDTFKPHEDCGMMIYSSI